MAVVPSNFGVFFNFYRLKPEFTKIFFPNDPKLASFCERQFIRETNFAVNSNRSIQQQAVHSLVPKSLDTKLMLSVEEHLKVRFAEME